MKHIIILSDHGRREVAFLNRAWEDVIKAELALDEGSQNQPLIDQIVNAKPSSGYGLVKLSSVMDLPPLDSSGGAELEMRLYTTGGE